MVSIKWETNLIIHNYASLYYGLKRLNGVKNKTLKK